MDADETMDELVRAVAASIEHRDGAVRIDDGPLREHAAAIARAAVGGRAERLAEELVGLAVRAAGEARDEFDDAIMQLSALAAIALGDFERAEIVLGHGKGEEGRARARALIGEVSSMTPVGAGGPAPGAASPLQTAIDSRKKSGS